jgi:outer membrane biosynthesis protein TonB
MFNDKKSIIYEDAERLRKTASNWMVKNNPAYRIQGYTAIATPVPGEEAVPPGRPIPRPVVVATPKPVTTPKPAATPKPKVPTPEVTSERSSRRTAVPLPSTPAPSKLRQAASAVPERDRNTQDFNGKSFQQAQEKIIKDLLEYVEPT